MPRPLRFYVLVLPNLFAAGFHGAEDIPARLGDRSSRRVRICPPVGTAPGIADLIVEMALSEINAREEGRNVAG